MEDSTPMKLDALHRRVGRVEETLVDFGRALSDNNEMTRGIARQMEAAVPKLEEIHAEYKKVYVPAKTTGTVITKVAVWSGKIALAATAIGGAVAAALHLGGGKQ
jgi:hypothetical protein